MLEALKSADFWFAICYIGIIVVAIVYIRYALFKRIRKSNHSDKSKR